MTISPITEHTTADGRQWTLRPARSEDAEPLARLYAAVRAEGRWLVTPPNAINPPSEAFFIAELIRADESAVLIADADGAVVGNALVMSDRDVSSRHVGVLSITVADGWRDVGIGTALVAATQDWVREPRPGAARVERLPGQRAGDRGLHPGWFRPRRGCGAGSSARPTARTAMSC